MQTSSLVNKYFDRPETNNENISSTALPDSTEKTAGSVSHTEEADATGGSDGQAEEAIKDMDTMKKFPIDIERPAGVHVDAEVMVEAVDEEAPEDGLEESRLEKGQEVREAVKMDAKLIKDDLVVESAEAGKEVGPDVSSDFFESSVAQLDGLLKVMSATATSEDAREDNLDEKEDTSDVREDTSDVREATKTAEDSSDMTKDKEPLIEVVSL